MNKKQMLKKTAAIFLALDFFAFLINALAIRRMKPVELLRESHTGEKEPKTKWTLLILGVLSLGTGYVIAVNVLPFRILHSSYTKEPTTAMPSHSPDAH